MGMKITSSGKKQFTKEEKLLIIEECKSEGVKSTCGKYGIYPGSYYYWKRKLMNEGAHGLEGTYHKQTKARIKILEKELETLKLLLAEEQLQSRLKDDLLKKKYPELRK